MGTTPVYDLPYPEGGDLIIAGDDAMQALAERIEQLLTPAYAITQGAGAPTQSGVTSATLATFDAIAFSSGGVFALEGGVTIRYTGPTRWFICDFEAVAVAGGAALAEVTARLYIVPPSAVPVLVASDAFSGAGASGRLRITTPIQLTAGDALQLGIEGTGGGAVFDDKQFRIASTGAPQS